MDRNKLGINQCRTGLFSVVAHSMYATFTSELLDARPLMDGLNANNKILILMQQAADACLQRQHSGFAALGTVDSQRLKW
jgi:hypothetical protein